VLGKEKSGKSLFSNFLAGKQIQSTGSTFLVADEIFKVCTQQHSRETKFLQLCESNFNDEPFTVIDTAAFADQASTLLDVINLL